jgi:hypothetical protein
MVDLLRWHCSVRVLYLITEKLVTASQRVLGLHRVIDRQEFEDGESVSILWIDPVLTIRELCHTTHGKSQQRQHSV